MEAGQKRIKLQLSGKLVYLVIQSILPYFVFCEKIKILIPGIRILLSFFLQGGATSNRKRVVMTLSFSKLYLCYDVSPLNKVFTALHRSTQVCILGTIPKGKYNKLFCYSIYDLGNSFSLTSFM